MIVGENASSQERAVAMLSIFKSRNVAEGESLMASDVFIDCQRSSGGGDFRAAMQYAERRNWLKDEGAVIRLLDAGRRAALADCEDKGPAKGAVV